MAQYNSNYRGLDIDRVVGNAALLTNASGSAVIPGFNAQTDTVHVTSQSLTTAQKTQARTNINAEGQVNIVSASGTTLSAQVGNYYRFNSTVTSLAVTLPTISGATTIQGCMFYLTTGSTISLTFTGGGTVKYQDGYKIKTGSTYEINAIWNGAVWVLAAIKIS